MTEAKTEDPLREYYAVRAQEYEHIYRRDDPQRQLEQLELAAAVGRTCLNRDVLEIACGTGYWTQFADRVARQVTAVDAAESVLRLASDKKLKHTRLVMGDAYSPPMKEGGYSAGLALFWFSHVPKNRRTEFLTAFHGKMQQESRILIGDNQYRPGIGGELTENDAAGDTFKIRRLQDGTTHRVLKNYFDIDELAHVLSPFATDLSVHFGHCFWWAEYKLKGEG